MPKQARPFKGISFLSQNTGKKKVVQLHVSLTVLLLTTHRTGCPVDSEMKVQFQSSGHYLHVPVTISAVQCHALFYLLWPEVSNEVLPLPYCKIIIVQHVLKKE